MRKKSHAVPCQFAVPLLVCARITDEPMSEYCAEKLFWRTRTSSRESGFGTTEVCVMLPVFSFQTPSTTYKLLATAIPLMERELCVERPPVVSAEPDEVFCTPGIRVARPM